MAYLLVFGFLWRLYARRTGMIRKGEFIGLFLVLVFSARFLLEFVKTPQAAYTLPFALSVGQLLSIPAVVIGLWLWFSSRAKPAG